MHTDTTQQHISLRMSKHDSIQGIAIALTIIVAWCVMLYLLLHFDVDTHRWFIFPACLAMTLLYTGLFITAHDAMHGSIARHFRRSNTLLGIIAVALYAVFSYRKLWFKHWEHHRHVASSQDPDYHDGVRTGFWAWYGHFLRNYVSVGQICAMAIIFNVLHHGAHIPLGNLLLFWVAPALLSTLQLFYFGTYRPHREPEHGYDNRHRSTSNDFPVWLSFLTCYHFGYHWEHHEYPSVSWWRLPRIRQQRTEKSIHP